MQTWTATPEQHGHEFADSLLQRGRGVAALPRRRSCADAGEVHAQQGRHSDEQRQRLGVLAQEAEQGGCLHQEPQHSPATHPGSAASSTWTP